MAVCIFLPFYQALNKVLAEENVSCLASDINQKNKESSNLFSLQNPLFSDDSDYQQWVERCRLPTRDFDRVRRSYFLIDVRDSVSYRRDHIAESVNMPVSSIKTKLFLKEKNILLIGEAYDKVSIVHSCKNLRTSGYPNVKVIESGFTSLIDISKNRVPDQNKIRPLKLDSNKLIYESRYEPWIIFDLSLLESSSLDKYFDIIYKLKSYPDSDRLNEIVKSIDKFSEPGFTPSFIVIDNDGKGYIEFKKWLQNIDAKIIAENGYYLEGGLLAFNKFVKKQEIILSKQEIVLTKPRGCAR